MTAIHSNQFEFSMRLTGSSMNPTLKPHDILQVVPYIGRKIRGGDVIVFLPPGSNRKVTHRVLFADSHIVRTRGDGNRNVDPWILSHDDVIGYVTCVQRKNKRIRIRAGFMGWFFAIGIRAFHLIGFKISLFLGPTYHWLARSGIFRRWAPFLMEPRVISFRRPSGQELQLLIGHRVIGRCLPGRNHWEIRRPFRLFVDESCLPR